MSVVARPVSCTFRGHCKRVCQILRLTEDTALVRQIKQPSLLKTAYERKSDTNFKDEKHEMQSENVELLPALPVQSSVLHCYIIKTSVLNKLV